MTEPDYRHFKYLGEFLKAYRLYLMKTHPNKKDFTQNRLGEILGYKGGQFISNIERSADPLPFKVAEKICKLYGFDRKIIEFYYLKMSHEKYVTKRVSNEELREIVGLK